MASGTRSSSYTFSYWIILLNLLEVVLGAYTLETTGYFLVEKTTTGRLMSAERLTRPIHERTRYGYFSFKNTTVRFHYFYTVDYQVFSGHRVSNLVAYPTPSYLPGPVTVYYCPFLPAWSTLQDFDLVYELGNLLPLLLNTFLLVRFRKQTPKGPRRTA